MSASRFLRAGAWAVVAALALWAQTGRDSYRAAYKDWRQAEPSLERDAPTAGAALGSRADHAAAQAQKFWNARRTFLDRQAKDDEQKFAWLSMPVSLPPVAATATDYIMTESAAVRRGLTTFADDPDPGIQRVKAMLNREADALSALNGKIVERQKAGDDADIATASIEDARRKALDQARAMIENEKKAVEDTGYEMTAWADYYRKLSDAARAPVTSSASSAIPERLPDVVQRPPSVTPLPLARYTGDWIYERATGRFHGAEPEFVDLVVREQNGKCDGRMTARFVLPASSPGDPILRFDFAGDLKNERVQTFPLKTSDGSTGTISLIPGSAFNLLEIAVQIADPKPNKVRQANVILIKK